MYATVDDVKTYLDISGTADDTLLSALIDRAQAAIERRTGRVFEAVSVSNINIWHDNIHGTDLFFPRDACGFYTDPPPVNYWIGSQSGNVLPISDAVGVPLDGPPYYALRILPRATVSWYDLLYSDEQPFIGLGALWAYSTTPPDDIVHATIRLAGYYYRQRDAQVYDVTAIPDAGVITVPAGIPADVDKLLVPYIKLI